MKSIADLKEAIELKFGRSITTPSVFDSLYLEIKKETGKEISVSTLKRIWGYVIYPHAPRLEILSILSQYLGFRDWKDFTSSNNAIDYSDFLTEDLIESERLIGGEIIQIAWAPDRICSLKYIGNSKYEVEMALNSKIQKGDILSCSIIAKGEPLMCSSILRDGLPFAECYIAAKNRGLNQVLIKQS